MAEAARVAARSLKEPGFKIGLKQVFLPDSVVTFLRKDHLPPNEACFEVPLRWNKLDLRDYLWNLYGVEVRKVRSYVKQQPLAQRTNLANSWYRPQSLKIMTVELAKPFQWPELPENKTPWHNELWEMREDRHKEQQEEQRKAYKGQIPLPSKQPESEDRKELRELAKKMLSGEVKWDNEVQLDPKWEGIVAEAEAKKGVTEEAAVDPANINKDGTPRQ